jgi:predicted PurR-regulated permease PerM
MILAVPVAAIIVEIIDVFSKHRHHVETEIVSENNHG